jgi:hypothetical protein
LPYCAACDVLKKRGCDCAPGYLFSPAVSEQARLALLKPYLAAPSAAAQRTGRIAAARLTAIA